MRIIGSTKSKVQRLLQAGLGASAIVLLATTLAAASPGSEPSLSQVTAPSAKDFVNGNFTCTSQHFAIVNERQQRIANAPTVEEARELALTPARAAKHALQVATLVAPSSEKLTEARAKLETFETRVQQSDTPAAVAGAFGQLLDLDLRNGNYVQLADLNVRHGDVRGPGSCHYTTGEIIAIVIGFILFIIPGIILIIVLC